MQLTRKTHCPPATATEFIVHRDKRTSTHHHIIHFLYQRGHNKIASGLNKTHHRRITMESSRTRGNTLIYSISLFSLFFVLFPFDYEELYCSTVRSETKYIRISYIQIFHKNIFLKWFYNERDIQFIFKSQICSR